MTALMAAVSLAATALIVPGTGTPNANTVGDYMENFRDYYMQKRRAPRRWLLMISRASTTSRRSGRYPCPGWCDPGRCEKFDVSVADGVDNLEDELMALQEDGYTGDVVIAGYSQGARVVSIAKTKIASGEWADLIDQLDSVEFVFIGNPNRPNGGILSRFGILGTIPIVDVTTGSPRPPTPSSSPKTGRSAGRASRTSRSICSIRWRWSTRFSASITTTAPIWRSTRTAILVSSRRIHRCRVEGDHDAP